jgi:hypothetical protein
VGHGNIFEIEIDGVLIKTGDEIDVRVAPGAEWARRRFLEATPDRRILWCAPTPYESSDSAHWGGFFDVKWCVRLPHTLDTIVKKIIEP